MNNIAKSEGGGICTRDSVVKFKGTDTFVANLAGNSNKGPAVYTLLTILNFQGSSSFVSNSAEYSGGLYSESITSHFYIMNLVIKQNYHNLASTTNQFTIILLKVVLSTILHS